MAPLLAFFGWMSVINLSLLLLSTVLIVLMQSRIARLHARMFQLEEAQVRRFYFQYLGLFKRMVLVLNVVPYLALRIVL